MRANRTDFGPMAVFLAVVAASSASAAEVEILNRTGARMNVYMWCQSHADWSDMAGNRQKGIGLLAKRKTVSDHHAGRYRIVVTAPDRTQFSEWVSIQEGKVNKFNIDARFGAPPGVKFIPYGISRENEDSTDTPSDNDGFVPTQKTSPEGTFAGNLGIYYESVWYSNGTFGARLTANPNAGSPAASVGLETGDIIYELDGQRFRTHADVLGHRYATTMTLINVRTSAPQSASVYIP